MQSTHYNALGFMGIVMTWWKCHVWFCNTSPILLGRAVQDYQLGNYTIVHVEKQLTLMKSAMGTCSFLLHSYCETIHWNT